MTWERVIFWGCAVAALCCYCYAAYILWAWPDPSRDTRLTDFAAAITAKRAAVFTFVMAGMFLALMAFIAHGLTAPGKKKPPNWSGG